MLACMEFLFLANKVNKEEIVGMLVSLEMFLDRDHAAVWKDWEGRCQTIIDALDEFEDVETEVNVPAIANAVPHLRISWDYEGRSLSVAEMARQLREGEPSIEVSPGSRRRLGIGVWMMEPGEDALVARRMREIFANT